jgi:hypothetical protein
MVLMETRDRRGGPSPAFWMAQALIGLLAIALVFHLMSADPAGNSVQATTKTVNPPSRGGKGRPSAGAVLSRIPDAPPGTPAASREGSPQTGSPIGRSSQAAPYRPDQYRTRLAKVEEDFQFWDLDPGELSWLLRHQRQVLTQDLNTLPESTGGMRVLLIQEGSFGALRGLRVGDILLNINGQDLDGPPDVEDLLEDPVNLGARGWRVHVLREGKPLTIDYRTAP